ncbi:hypothetical protein BDN71DRAFT_1182605 [Pleurotus eryngii]|uniref:Uncharacterized protein n=1 Tax=Pleurotus eryngii TaxID=5323 RepID=A0A9P5ZS88_PLEER|nr:hypothetical protein BDN71DRAFT_1182605 [Pleurotus eryngii]
MKFPYMFCSRDDECTRASFELLRSEWKAHLTVSLGAVLIQCLRYGVRVFYWVEQGRKTRIRPLHSLLQNL